MSHTFISDINLFFCTFVSYCFNSTCHCEDGYIGADCFQTSCVEKKQRKERKRKNYTHTQRERERESLRYIQSVRMIVEDQYEVFVRRKQIVLFLSFFLSFSLSLFLCLFLCLCLSVSLSLSVMSLHALCWISQFLMLFRAVSWVDRNWGRMRLSNTHYK